ncbi:MAG: ANTAR domain-containing protein [Mycobacterium sp.]
MPSSEVPIDRSLVADEQRRISVAVEAIADSRALIEQTKGMLMFVYGIDADAAFDVLRWQSQQHNVKLRLIAEQILKDLVELSKTKGPARRLAFDGLMLTAHQRITHSAARQTDGASTTAG